MKPFLIVSVTIVLFLTGCSKVIDIKIEEEDLKIVLSGLICPDSTVIVHISRSSQVSGDYPEDTGKLEPDSMIVDPVSLYENDRFIGELQYRIKSYYELPGFKPSPGKTYRLEASSGELKPVSATVVVPEMADLTSFDTLWIPNMVTNPTIRVSMQLSDPPDQENYYALNVLRIQRYYDGQTNRFTDSIVAYGYPAKLNGKADGELELDFLDVNRDVYLDGKLFFSDQFFDGKIFHMSFDILKNSIGRMADTVLFRVNVQQVDKSYYDYAVSYQKYFSARNNPFTEPVQVYSNVTDGYGLFSAYNCARKEFVVDWTGTQE